MKLLRTIAAITLSTSLLAACGGSGESVSTPVGETGGTSSRVAFDGSVGDGPVVGATVSIRDRNFRLLATTSSTDRASFNFDGEIADSAFPLIIEATEGIDLVTNAAPDFVLSGVVMTPSQTRVNLTPHTTMMVKSALAMEGGLTQANLERARSAVTTRLNFGLDTSKVPDPMSTEVTIDNVTEVTLSSEVFGEMARRTAYWIGGNVSEDDIFTALAADLVDSVLDGRGAEGTVARYTAIAHVVSAQVLIEAMLDGLQVNNQPANTALDDAIDQVLSTADRSIRRSVTEVNVNSLMLSQAQAALAAAQAIDPNIPLGDLLSLLSGLQNGTAGNTDEALSNAGVDNSLSNGLDQTISIVANSNNSGVEQVNQVASGSDASSSSGSESVSTVDAAGSSTSTGDNSNAGSTNEGDGSAGTVNTVPTAIADNAETNQNSSVIIDILANDSGIDNSPITLTIAANPNSGSVQVNSDGTISYQPNNGFFGSDRFSYQLMDTDGDSAMAEVTITVNCTSNCSAQLRLTWSENTTAQISGYKIYHGTSSGNYGEAIWAGDVTSYDYTAESLGNHYFSVTAVDTDGNESAYANEVAIQL
ncbi:Ig-like domain-containing protein [Candidatus Endoriftia persephone]|uniref:Ig-like domain-containing protein n=2 Tax=Gammaproteobacteria TaxID=1236 RepID=A0A9J6ZVZ4_9GAMM|nr:Ig-like domain-containing protein [Candidatus Endoriftia persephone]USF86791.1 Ig-like domain-containing protein [Candidatus Endoriftia persephone]